MRSNFAQKDGLQIFTVSELTQMTTDLLQECFSDIWLTGEISNLAIPASGHAYLTLKDEKSQLRIVIFKGVYPKIRSLTNGMMITLWGQMKIYAARGELQVVARQVMTEGDGPLAIQFEQLKQFCAKQGWFSAEHKLPIPEKIKRIGVITSATGAALYDVLKVLSRRNPGIEVVVYPSQVQGDLAPKQLINALQKAQQHAYVDVILLTRGGGSAEDLFCFNDVDLIKAIYECTLPIVSAVGHEVDTTLADWAADERAATPSAGAEILSEDTSQYLSILQRQQQYATQCMQQRLRQYQHRLQLLQQACKSPVIRVKQQQQLLQQLQQTTQHLMQTRLQLQQATLKRLSASIHALNPLSILERGYAMVTDQQTGQVITAAAMLKSQQQVNIQFATDQAQATID